MSRGWQCIIQADFRDPNREEISDVMEEEEEQISKRPKRLALETVLMWKKIAKDKELIQSKENDNALDFRKRVEGIFGEAGILNKMAKLPNTAGSWWLVQEGRGAEATAEVDYEEKLDPREEYVVYRLIAILS